MVSAEGLHSVMKVGVAGALALTLAACGSNSTGTNGSVNFGIQGTHPDSLAVLSEQAIGVMSRLSGAQRSALAVDSSSSVDIEVLGTSGTGVGTLTVTDARVVLKRIKFKTLEEREQEAESDDDSSLRQAWSESESESEDELEDEADACGASEDSSETEDHIVFRGPFVVDLLSNESTPSFSELQVPAGDYREIEMRLHKVRGCERNNAGAEAVASDDPLFGQSVIVQGVFTSSDGLTTRNFTFVDDISEEFELSGASESVGFTVQDGVSQNILVAFRMAKWFDFTGKDISIADLGGSGDILLNSSVSGDEGVLHDLVLDNLKESADYGKDEDQDGKLETEEDDDEDGSVEDENDD